MIDASNPNYSKTLSQLEKLTYLIEDLEEKFSSQLPQGLAEKFTSSKKDFLEWVEEIMFTLEEYRKNCRK